MPRGDQTGPLGKGSMTGRKLGKCVGNNEGGYMYDEHRQRRESRHAHRHHWAGNQHGHQHGWRHRYED